MGRAAIDGVELEYEFRGSGEPVVLIHWGVGAIWAEPLLEQPALGGYALLRYARAGYGRSSAPGGLTIADHAEHCARLLERLGLERAHVVGHSSSVLVALQLALDHPAAVQSLALLDAARPAPESEVQTAFTQSTVLPAIAAYRAGDHAAAVDTFLRGVFGPDYRPALQRGLPGAFDDAVASADTFFAQELPSLQAWTLTPELAQRIDQPALLVLGEHSVPTFRERQELLASLLPHARLAVLPGATHMLHVEQPAGMAELLAGFFARHAAAQRGSAS